MVYQFISRAKEGFVPYDKLYEITKDRSSYGFLTEINRHGEERLAIPELNDGFQEVSWLKNAQFTKLGVDGNGVFVDYLSQGRLPLTFVCDLPQEGNYRVKVTFEATRPVKDAMLFIGRRHLAFMGDLRGGQTFEGEFLTNICPIIPEGFTEPQDDFTLDVTLIGEKLHLKKIEIEFDEEASTLYLAGDGSVADQKADYPYLSGQSCGSWGQMLSYYVGTQMAVSNHAHAGLTCDSFRKQGHYDIIKNRIKPGDICLIQFGHNDHKVAELAAENGYQDRLIDFIKEIKAKGAKVGLVSPIARNNWEGQEADDVLETYQKVCQKLAQDYELPYVELQDMGINFVKNVGKDRAKAYYFPAAYKHTNDYGAFLFAGFVYNELAGNGIFKKKKLVDWTAPEVAEKLVIPEEYK